MQGFKIIKYIFVTGFVVLCGTMYMMGCNDEKASIVVFESSVIENDLSIDMETTAIMKKTVYIYVTGAVCNSGVYIVDENARVWDVIILAGGFTKEADEKSVNMARRVVDGEHIHVYELGETYSNIETTTGLININNASKDELMELPGIGESRALSIISYRNEYGRFETIEDIMNVSGIKQAAFDKIKEYICVN